MFSLLVIILGIGITYAFASKESRSMSVGLAKRYDSIKEIAANAEVIVVAKINREYKTENVISGDKEMVHHVYNVSISKVLKNRLKDYKIKKDDSLSIYDAIGFMKEGKFFSITDHKSDMEAGTYLLFLNYPYFESLGKHVFVHHSPAHLYKLVEGSKTYKNLHSDVLQKIDEASVEQELLN